MEAIARELTKVINETDDIDRAENLYKQYIFPPLYPPVKNVKFYYGNRTIDIDTRHYARAFDLDKPINGTHCIGLSKNISPKMLGWLKTKPEFVYPEVTYYYDFIHSDIPFSIDIGWSSTEL